MKKLLFLLLLIPFLGNSQATFTAPVGYNTGAPTATPSGVGTRWRFDLLTGKKYTWLPGTLSWDEDARGIDQVAGCSAPLYTPGYNQSTFAVNSCTVPELYQWTGAAWARLNEGEVYTAGTGISIDGSNVISNTSPNIVQTLSIAGQDLTLSNGGGTVAIPAGSSLGIGFTSGGGSGTIPDKTEAVYSGDTDFGTAEFKFQNGNASYYQANYADGFPFWGIESIDVTNEKTAFVGFNSDDPTALLFGSYDVGTGIGSTMSFGSGLMYIASPSINFESNTDMTINAPLSIFTGGIQPASYTSAAAPNNCIFYSTTVSKLCYKDPGGTVNPLY